MSGFFGGLGADVADKGADGGGKVPMVCLPVPEAEVEVFALSAGVFAVVFAEASSPSPLSVSLLVTCRAVSSDVRDSPLP